MNTTRLLSRVAPQVRQMSVIAGPPRVRISSAEKLAHGLAIAVSILGVPAYILVNLQSYKAKE